MGIVNNIVNFVFPVQRQLYRPAGRFTPNPNQFRSRNLPRRFSPRRLWPNGQMPSQRARFVPSTQTQVQFRRPLARTINSTPQSIQMQPVARIPSVPPRNFLSEMLSTNINPPAQRPQPKRNGFGSTAFKFMRLNGMMQRLR